MLVIRVKPKKREIAAAAVHRDGGSSSSVGGREQCSCKEVVTSVEAEHILQTCHMLSFHTPQHWCEKEV